MTCWVFVSAPCAIKGCVTEDTHSVSCGLPVFQCSQRPSLNFSHVLWSLTLRTDTLLSFRAALRRPQSRPGVSANAVWIEVSILRPPERGCSSQARSWAPLGSQLLTAQHREQTVMELSTRVQARLRLSVDASVGCCEWTGIS